MASDRIRILSLVALLNAASTLASATSMEKVLCSILMPIGSALRAIGPSLFLVMFVYGAVKYAYSAEDPAGRKQGMSICIHSLVGGIILLMTGRIVQFVFIVGKIFPVCPP
jgi:hypothetical protein